MSFASYSFFFEVNIGQWHLDVVPKLHVVHRVYLPVLLTRMIPLVVLYLKTKTFDEGDELTGGPTASSPLKTLKHLQR